VRIYGLVPSEIFFDFAELVRTGDAPGLMSSSRACSSPDTTTLSSIPAQCSTFATCWCGDRRQGADLSLLPDEAERMTRQPDPSAAATCSG